MLFSFKLRQRGQLKRAKESGVVTAVVLGAASQTERHQRRTLDTSRKRSHGDRLTEGTQPFVEMQKKCHDFGRSLMTFEGKSST